MFFLKNKLCISMIPYPSGKIHLGHSRNYLINDIFNRVYNLFNKNSFMFISWDSFGTPAENASLIRNIKPLKFINFNIRYMKKQLKFFFLSINWIKEFETFKLYYYYFNQIIFLKFLKKNFLYISDKKVNWDNCDKSVLSNEQIINGKGWRTSCVISKKNIYTYYLKIRFYKKELLNELLNLDWPINVKLMQFNWIIKKIFIYSIFNKFFNFKFKKIFFIKNLSHIFYIFLFLFFIKNIFLNLKLKNLSLLYNILIIGLILKNIFNYFSEISFLKNIFFNFENKFNSFNNLKIKSIIVLNNFLKNLYYFEFYIFFKIKEYKFLIIKWKIKDWGISRQRYWGTPIPSIFCNTFLKYYLICFKKLPLFIFKNLNKNIFFYNKSFNKYFCFFCKKKHFNEFYTIDTFFDSSWYFLRYFLFRKKINYNLPIDTYIGGVEHSILHLLYSRYFIKFLRDFKYLNFGEPFNKLICQGTILSRSLDGFSIKFEKMSKSKNNIITPEESILNHSIDSFRLTILKNSLIKDFYWKEKLIKSSFNFLKKLTNKIKKNNFINNFFFNKNFFKKNFKLMFNFFYKNSRKLIFFLKKNYYNNYIIFISKFLKSLNKACFFFLNYFFLSGLYLNFLKFLYPLTPLTVLKIIYSLKNFKIKNFKKIFYKKFFNIFLKKKNIKKRLLIRNKIIGDTYIKIFFIKKKILNFFFFKKKIKKKYFFLIINIHYLINILIKC